MKKLLLLLSLTNLAIKAAELPIREYVKVNLIITPKGLAIRATHYIQFPTRSARNTVEKIISTSEFREVSSYQDQETLRDQAVINNLKAEIEIFHTSGATKDLFVYLIPIPDELEKQKRCCAVQ